MAQVHVISECNITAASENGPQVYPHPTMEFTPFDLDLLLLEYNQMGLLFRKPVPHEACTFHDNIIDSLKSSLARTLQLFVPLSGRLRTIETEGKIFFSCECNNKGAVFIHARVEDMTLANILDPTYVPHIVHSFFPLNGVCNYEGLSQPLLGIQVTELVDGFFIGCSINHLLADGTSFWHFFNSWSNISRGLIDRLKIPIFKRDILLDIQGSSKIAIPKEAFGNCTPDRFWTIILSRVIESSRRASLYDAHVANQTCSPPLKERILHFTKTNIAKLKEKANHEMKTKKISSLQAILAHMWRSIIHSRGVYADEETTFEIPMGVRQRLNPPLPDEYFGNAFFPGIVTLSAGELLKNGLGWTAWQLNNMVASKGYQEIKGFYEDWIKRPGWIFLGLVNNHFVLINSPRFDVYGNDFGWGKPVAVRSGKGNTFDGRITIYAGLEEGSIDIEVCSSAETLHAMEGCSEFMKAMT